MSTVKANEYRHLNNTGTEPNLTLSNNASVEIGNDLTVPQGSIDTNGNASVGGNTDITGNLTINGSTQATGDITGNLKGDVKDSGGNVVVDVGTGNNATFDGNLTGNVTGNVTGDVKDSGGNVVVDVGTGDNATFDGDLSGDVTGDVTGDVEGDIKSPDGTVVLNNGTGAGTDSTFTGTATNATNAADSTNAYHVQVTVQSTAANEENLIPFVEGAATTSGKRGLEMDAALKFNPSTGTVTATKFSGNGASLTDLAGDNIATGTINANRVPTLNQDTTGSAATLTTGRTISTTGDVTYTSGSFDGSADVTGVATIPDETVTYAKIQKVSATNRILGRDSAAAGPIEEISPADLRAMINVADGATNTQAPHYTAAISNATTSAAGLMSSTDKTKLDSKGTNGDGARTVSTSSSPSGGSNGDIWYVY